MLTKEQLQVAIANAVTAAVYDVLGQAGVLDYAPATSVPATVGASTAAPSAPAAEPVVSIPTMDKVPYQTLNGFRVDDIVPAGYPGTVAMPVTGHVLSVARPSLGESFVGYCQRVAFQAAAGNQAQAKLNEDQVGRLMQSGTIEGVFEHLGVQFVPNNWPIAADAVFNIEAYMTPAEKAAEAEAAARWSAAMAAGQAAQRDATVAQTDMRQRRQGKLGRFLGANRDKQQAVDTPVAG